MPQQSFCVLKTIFAKHLADARAAHPVACHFNGPGIFDAETSRLANTSQKGKITGAVTAKAEIVPHYQMMNPQAVDQYVLDKPHAGIAAEVFIEAQAQDNIDTGSQQGFEFLSEGHQSWRCIDPLEKFPGLGLENHDNRGHTKLNSLFTHLIDNGLMAQVDTVEISDSRHAAIGQRSFRLLGKTLQIGQAPDETHVTANP
jgi:hypothetical protein